MALVINPLVFDAYKAQEAYDNLLEENRIYLPQFEPYFKSKMN